jgi:hypothetical protein
VTGAELRTAANALVELWDRLQAASAYSGASAGHPAPKSRAPISLSVVSLTMEISAATSEAAEEYGRASSSVTVNLVTIVNHLASTEDNDVRAWWTETCRDWVGRAEVALGLSAPGTKWIRGMTCPVCRSRTAHGHLDGELVRTPALAVTWREDYGDWRVHAIGCRACGSVWTRDAGGLADLAATLLSHLRLPLAYGP